MGKRLCASITKTGAPCQNYPTHFSTLCAEHLQHAPPPAEYIKPCNIQILDNGYHCLVHDTQSEEWQVMLALGAVSPCRAPGNAPMQQRKQLAESPSSSVETYRMLLQDQAPIVRKALAGNPAVPSAVLHQLAVKATMFILQALLGNCSLSAETHQMLALHPDPNIQAAAIRTAKSLPPHLLIQLASSPQAFVRLAAYKHPDVPKAVLAAAKQDTTVANRIGAVLAAQHTMDVLELFLEDTSVAVSALAAQCKEDMLDNGPGTQPHAPTQGAKFRP